MAAAWFAVFKKRNLEAAAENQLNNGGVPLPAPGLNAVKSSKPLPWSKQYIELPYRAEVEKFYQRPLFQILIGVVIIFNFIVIIVEKEIDPYPLEYQIYPNVWLRIDDVCNIIFLIELIINFYGSCWKPFVTRGWNYLDVAVVIVGVISLARVPLEPPADKIKVLRALRVLRLFKRVKSLNKILVALVYSIPGVVNAFIVMLIFMMIFAVVAVDLFRPFGEDGTYDTIQRYGGSDAVYGEGEGMTWSREHPYFENKTTVSAMTARGFYYGQEYYGTFMRSLYTLFQVLTGESWSEAVVRPLLFGYTPGNALLVGIFFTLYILLTQVVLQNVVVAVLLDKFTASGDDGEEKEDAEDPAASAAEATTAVKAESMVLAPAATASGAKGSSSSNGGADAAAIVELRADVDRILAHQEAIKQQLSAVLALLPKKAGAPSSELLA